MARARNIKPSIMENEQLAALPAVERLLFIYLWMLADRKGRLEDRPQRIAVQALPYDRDVNVDAALTHLDRAGFIKRYSAENKQCIQILAFSKHQTPHVREQDSQLPEYVQGTTKAVTRHRQGSDVSSPRSPDFGFSDSGFSDSGFSANAQSQPAAAPSPPKNGTRFVQPTADQVREYADSINFTTLDSAKFIDHYTANGWKVGRNPMKDWRAAVRTWRRSDQPQSTGELIL